MADQSQVWRSSLSTTVRKVASRPHLPVDRTYIHDGRACLVVVATVAVAVNAWALFPSPDISGHDAALSAALPPSGPAVNPAGKGVADVPLVLPRVSELRFMSAELSSSGPRWQGPVEYSISSVTTIVVPLRSKLQALLMMLYAQAGDDIDLDALKAKLEALLKLPDSVLAALMRHPDLAAFNETLDAVFQGTADMSVAKTELDKIEVVTTSGPTERIDVVKVNGEPTYVVHSAAVPPETQSADGATMSVTPQPPAVYTVESVAASPADISAFAAPVSIAPPAAPEQSARIMAAPTIEPSIEPAPPAIQPVGQVESAFTETPSAAPTPTAAPVSAPPSSPDWQVSVPETSSPHIVTMDDDFESEETGTPTHTAEPPADPSADPSPSGAPDETGGETNSNDGPAPSNNNEGNGDSSDDHGSPGDSSQ